ncbi:hypothetical protein AWB79_05535 [Caballeronia hypogeia]|uniref:Ig-like domain-containing protein n=1 Tax=Caballeronia hypogeia TaxID=1777140 RepID=A0A158CKJ1_9BURK|nr:hypothetical protein [Caballeronia hypogeia]SAK82822.1 hypothetical protein AWB79_05535 [Caballeronia hypogeia]
MNRKGIAIVALAIGTFVSLVPPALAKSPRSANSVSLTCNPTGRDAPSGTPIMACSVAGERTGSTIERYNWAGTNATISNTFLKTADVYCTSSNSEARITAFSEGSPESSDSVATTVIPCFGQNFF